jgi:hypothetical protein
LENRKLGQKTSSDVSQSPRLTPLPLGTSIA